MGLFDGLIASLPDAKGSTPSAKSSSTGGGEIESLLRNKAAEYDIDPDLFVSLAKRESGLRPDAKNPGSTAGGLFQFIDGTWNRYGNKKDKFDPEANADAAARMLRDHLGMFDGDYSKALAAHHVGASKAASALTDRRIGDKDVSTQQWLSDIFTGAGRDNPMAKPRGAFADAEAGVGGYDQIRRGQIAQAESDASPVSTSLKRGLKGLTHSAGLAIDNMLGDSEGAAQRIIDKQAFDQATPAPSSVQKFGRDWDELAEDDYSGMFGTILKNPAGSFNMMLEQTPNSLPGMTFQTIAGVAGRGLMAFGPVGAAAGLALQSAAALAGNFLPEGGAFLEDELHKSGVDTNDVRAMTKWIEEHRGENFKGGATKAGVISAVDGVTGWMGMKMLAGPSVRFAKAEKDFFAKNGVNVADSAALQAARASDAYKTALQPFAADLVKASEGFGMFKRGVGATALDAMGEGVGEYAGSYAATGDASIKDAVLEGVMGVGQGAAMAGAQYGIGKMSGPDLVMEELRKLATANIAPAEAKPNSPLSNAAQAAQAADPITEALKPISERFADLALYEQIRNHPNLGPDAMTQILSAYRVATDSNMDPMARQAAVDRLGEFFRLFDNQPNFTAGKADAPGVPAVVGNPSGAVGPADPRVGAIDGEASRVTPNQQQGAIDQSYPALATDERARKAAEAEYEAAYQDLVKAEQLGASDQELMQRQIAMRNAENRLQEINEAIEANRAKETAEKRGALLDRVLASNPGNPNRAFDRALRLEGFRDSTFTEEEKSKIARFNELRNIQEDGISSAPNEAGDFGIREKLASAPAGRYQHLADMLSSGWQLANRHQLTGPNGEVYNLKGAGEAQFVRNKLNQKAGNGNQSPRGGAQGGTDQGDFGVGGAGANGPVPQGGGNGSGQANALPDTRPADGAVSEAEATGAGSQPNDPLNQNPTGRLTPLDDPRIAKYAGDLRSMAPDAGYAERGGRNLRDHNDNFTSRTVWIPTAEWFLPGMLNSPQASVDAVERAIRGYPMKKKEKLHVQGMMDFLDMQYGIDGESHAEQLATLSDIAYEGESADAQNIIDMLGDVDLESNGAWADEVESMRALGFTEEEINEITRRKQGAFGSVGEEAAGVSAGETQGAIPEGDGNGNGQAEGQEGFSLNQQTNTEAAAQFAQQQAGEPTEITKEQADKERDAVPFSMQMQSQPKPQGTQVGLFTADGRPSVAAKQPESVKRKIFRDNKETGVREVHEVDAQDVAISELPDHQFFVFKDEEKGAYSLTEASTGLRVGVGETAESAIADFKGKLEKIGADTFAKRVADSPKIQSEERTKPVEPNLRTRADEDGFAETEQELSDEIGIDVKKLREKADKASEDRQEFPVNIDVNSFVAKFPEFDGYGISSIRMKKDGDIDVVSTHTLDGLALRKYTYKQFLDAYKSGEVKAADVTPANEGDIKQGAENKEPNLEAAKALIQEAKDTHGDKRKEAAVRKKARELAQKTPLSDEKTVLALDMVSTRLGMGDGGTKALEFLPSVDGEQNKPASVSGKAGIDSWRSEFESAKKDGDKAKIQALYDKVRIVLNGIAQSHGDKAVSDFNALKKEIEQYAKNQQESAADEQEAGGDAEKLGDTKSYSEVEKKLINGEINVEDFMSATGLTDDDVGFLTGNDLRQQADVAAKENSPYFSGIRKLSAAIFKEIEGLSRGSTAQSRRAYDANLAKYKAAQDTLEVIAKNFEHPFRNTLLSKLPPFLESRYSKQWDSVEYGDKAKKSYRSDSYSRWVDLLIDAARKKSDAKQINNPDDSKPDQAQDFSKYILISADDISKLRKIDVERVLEQGAVKQFRQEFADWIKAKRPDLAQEVDAVMAELSKRKVDTKPAQTEKPLTVGKAPNGAEPVSVRDGVLYIGEDPVLDYETEQEVRVGDNASNQEIADSASSPVNTSMRDTGAKAFTDGLPRVAPEGIKGADKVRWLTGYDEAAKESRPKNDAAKDFLNYPTQVLSYVIRNGQSLSLYKAAGVRSADAFTGLPISEQADAYAKFVQDGGSPADGLPSDYNEWVRSQENDAESRRMQSERIIRQTNGKPFKNESGAKQVIDRYRLTETHEVVPTDGGYELQQLTPAAQLERRRKAEGKESYVEAQEAVMRQLGIEANGDGEYDLTEDQWANVERHVDARLRGNSSQQKTDTAPKASEQAAPVSQPKNDKPAYADDAELQDALSHLGDVLGDVFGAKLNITGKQYGASDLLPAMSKVIELLIKKGFKSFRESVGAATNAMRGNANTKGFVDQITPRQWKAAYNSVAEFHEGTDSEEDVAKYSAEQIQKIIALPEKIKEAEQATNHDATPGQKEAGNYAKGKFAWHGLNIAVETAKGEDRTDKETNGEKWRVTMPATYGYVLGTVGADKDHVDVFMGDKPESQRVYVVNQTKPGSTEFDEHKIMLGYESEGAAIGDYLLSFSDTFGASVLGSVSGPYAIDDFKHMLESNRFSRAKPISDRLAYVNPRVEEKPVEQQPPGVKTNGTKEKAAAERLAQLLDKMDQVRIDRNTPEGSAKGIVRSVIEELRKERTAVSVADLLATASQRLLRQHAPFSEVIDQVVESLRSDASPDNKGDIKQAGVSLDKFGLTVRRSQTKNGTPTWEVSGNTRDHVAVLRNAGGKWYGPKKVWSFFSEESPEGRILAALGASPAASGVALSDIEVERKSDGPGRIKTYTQRADEALSEIDEKMSLGKQLLECLNS